jgi:broad specificity phosphatase PhoE
MSSVKIAFIRHAQSRFNAYNDLSPNSSVTEAGKKSCKNITGNYDLVICSTLRRARETLDNSNITYKRVIFTDLCREILDGNTSNLYNGEENASESHEDVMQRISKLKEFIMQQPEANQEITNTAVISHGCFLFRMIGQGFCNCQCIIATI